MPPPLPPLLALPPELRLEIYTHIPILTPQSHDTQILVSSPLTPSLSRVNRQLRAETLPLYAMHTRFAFEMDGRATGHRRVRAWAARLGDANLARVRALQLSRHWSSGGSNGGGVGGGVMGAAAAAGGGGGGGVGVMVGRPTRGEGHSGFYVRVQRMWQQPPLPLPAAEAGERQWVGMGNTFPVSRDRRGQRWEMVEELVGFLRAELSCLNHAEGKRGVEEGEDGEGEGGLTIADVELIIRGMDAVAAHVVAMRGQSPEELGRRLKQIRLVTTEAAS